MMTTTMMMIVTTMIVTTMVVTTMIVTTMIVTTMVVTTTQLAAHSTDDSKMDIHPMHRLPSRIASYVFAASE